MTPSAPEPRTRLAALRVSRRVSQSDLAEVTGLSLRTIQRLESGEIDNPPLRYLVNLAIALGVPFDELVEDQWREWTEFSAYAPRPPSPDWYGAQGAGAGWTRSRFFRSPGSGSDDGQS